MAAETVRSDFDQMKDIQGKWNTLAENTQNAIQNLNGKMEALKGGDWYGDSATKFFNEMDSVVMPAMKRAQQAFSEAGKVTISIAQTIKQAEDECSGIMNGSKLF